MYEDFRLNTGSHPLQYQWEGLNHHVIQKNLGNVAIAIVNHPPFITIFMGGMFTINLMGGFVIAIPTL